MNGKIKIWERKYNFLFTSKKPIGIRMGRGYGKIMEKIIKIDNGNIILEFASNKNNLLYNLIHKYKLKFSLKTKIIKKI